MGIFKRLIKEIRLLLIVLIFLAAIFLNNYRMTPTGAVVSEEYNLDYAIGDLEGLKNQYNSNLDNVPNIVKTLFGDEKINLTITRDDGTKVMLSIETSDGVLKNITTDEFDDYTLNVWLDESVINEIVDSEDQIVRLEEALDNDEIQYESASIGTSIKLWFSEVALSVISWFR